MLFRTPQVDITKLDKEHCGADAMAEIRDDSIFARRNEQQEHAHYELRPRQAYWFRCPTCNFDWREWLKPSIIFVSLSFVTDTCPNCRRRHVHACGVGLQSDMSAPGQDSEGRARY
jgi:hypothetical protein